MEFNSSFTSMLRRTTAEGNAYHKNEGKKEKRRNEKQKKHGTKKKGKGRKIKDKGQTKRKE